MTNLFFKSDEITPIFTKHHIYGIPWSTAVIHEFSGVEIGEQPHDHPWNFTSFIIKGWYVEKQYEIIQNGWIEKIFHRKKGDSFQIKASTIHQIVGMSLGGCFTVILPEEETRKWGFYKFDNANYHRFHDEPEFKKIVSNGI